MTESVIRIERLRKAYGETEAVRGIDLEVSAGEVFAFLGPNGAGKTTTVEILEGYREPTAGQVTVLGVDPLRAPRTWRQRIGVVLQQCEMQPELTVKETLAMYAGYYGAPRDVTETVELVGLGAQTDQRAGSLSGGQQRRLDVAVALVGDPELLFLDEPTTGFDPSARRQAWDVIANLRRLGKTVFLTTHYMDEAQALADRVAVIAAGEIVAEGTPDDLGGRREAASVISFRMPAGAAGGDLPESLATMLAGPPEDGEVVLSTPDPVPALHELTSWALERRMHLNGLEVRRPSLEDVYLELIATAEDER